MEKSPYFVLLIAILSLSPHASGPMPNAYLTDLSLVSTYSVVQFNGNQSFSIQITPDDTSFTTPRAYHYMGVGGDGLTLGGVSISNSTGFMLGRSAAGGIIWLPQMTVGNYTVSTYGRGRFLLTQDVQNSGDTFVGNVSAPIAFFMVPFQRGGMHLDIQVSHPSDGYRLDLYNSSLIDIYSQQYTGNSSFDFALPSQGGSLIYALVSPNQQTAVKFTWLSTPNGVAIIGLLSILFPALLIAALAVFVIIRSRRGARTMSGTAIDVNGLTFSFKDKLVVNQANFSVPAGSNRIIAADSTV